MGCGSGGGGQSSTVTQTTSPPPEVLAAYQALLNRGTGVANLPLQQWQGPTIAGFNPTQQTAFTEVNQAQGAALPYINAAQQYLGAGAAPVMANVMQWSPQSLAAFENPYTQQVAQATQNLFDAQNAEQFNQARGNAASAGAFGGDREAVLEAQMAQQQQLAEAPTLAGIESQGFTTAAGLLGQQQQLQLQGMEGDAWRAANAAAMEAGLGQQAQGSLLSGASSELQTGALEQQLQQEELNVPIEQFLQQQGYPFQSTNFLAGITEGIGPGMGATSSTTSPGPNMIGQIGGLGLAGLGFANQAGWFGGSSPAGASGSTLGSFVAGYRGGGRIRRGPGGLVPTLAGSGLVPDIGLGDTGPGAFANLTAADMADIDQGVALAGASPVSMPPNDGHALTMPSVITAGGSGGGSSSSAGSSLLQMLPMAMTVAAMFMNRGGRAGYAPGGGVDPSLGPMGGTAAILGGLFGSKTGNLLAGLGGDWLGAVDMANDPGLTQLADPLQILRRGGRLVPGPHHEGFPRALGSGGTDGDAGAPSFDLNDSLIQLGAGMMASRSPFLLSQLGEGLQAASRHAPAHDSDAPRVDDSGPLFRLRYAAGRTLRTPVPNINAPLQPRLPVPSP